MTRTIHTHDDVALTIDRLTLASWWRQAPDGRPPQAARFRRILVATDGSEAARHAIDWAILLAQHVDADVHIISCVAPPPYAFEEPLSDYPASAAGSLTHYQALVRDEKQAAKRLLTTLEAELKDKGIKVTTEASFGHPPKRIIEAAETEDADLIVLGAHEPGILGHLFASNTSDTVRRRAPCHVLVANGAPDFERVLIPVDGSEESRAAAYTGHELARRLHKDELFLHVFPRPMFADETRAHALYDEALAHWAKKQGVDPTHDTPLPSRLRYGTSVREIVDEAADPPSLIVMGTRGLTGAKARLLGSVSHATVHAAPTAVLLVKDHGPGSDEAPAPRH